VIEVCIRVQPLDHHGLSRPERLTVLRGQLTLLRMRVEQGISISVQAIARAEQLARSLELHEVAA